MNILEMILIHQSECQLEDSVSAWALSFQPKILEILEQMVWKLFSLESFHKIQKLLNFQIENHSTENSGNSGSNVKIERKFPKGKFQNFG